MKAWVASTTASFTPIRHDTVTSTAVEQQTMRVTPIRCDAITSEIPHTQVHASPITMGTAAGHLCIYADRRWDLQMCSRERLWGAELRPRVQVWDVPVDHEGDNFTPWRDVVWIGACGLHERHAALHTSLSH